MQKFEKKRSTKKESKIFSPRFRKVPLASESLLSSVGTSPVTSQHAPSAASVTTPLLSSPSNSLLYTATFPQSTSTAGVFSIRDPAQAALPVSPLGKSRNGVHKASRPSKDLEDSISGSTKRKNSSHSSSFSSPFLFPTVDNHKRNGSSYHTTLQGSGAAPGAAAKKKGGFGHGGLWSSGEDLLSKAEGSQNHNSQNRLVRTALIKSQKSSTSYDKVLLQLWFLKFYSFLKHMRNFMTL